MSGKFGCTIDSSSVKAIDYTGFVKASERQPEFYRYGPPASTASDIQEVGDIWAEVERMDPNGDDLLKIASLFPAPDDWD